ncbi:MAG: hypothetical protein HOV80_17070 [Polyangiaceae bacterium]|nr:hypothetical protein [Polyangiaceae bacterium]
MTGPNGDQASPLRAWLRDLEQAREALDDEIEATRQLLQLAERPRRIRRYWFGLALLLALGVAAVWWQSSHPTAPPPTAAPEQVIEHDVQPTDGADRDEVHVVRPHHKAAAEPPPATASES